MNPHRNMTTVSIEKYRVSLFSLYLRNIGGGNTYIKFSNFGGLYRFHAPPLDFPDMPAGRAVPQYYRGTAVLLFHGTSTVKVTVLPWYRNTTNTAVLPYGTCQQIVISAKIFVR